MANIDPEEFFMCPSTVSCKYPIDINSLQSSSVVYMTYAGMGIIDYGGLSYSYMKAWGGTLEVQVLVKWKDYPDEESSWEPLQNLNESARKDAKRLIKQRRMRT